jgi:hypothetical protein
MLGGVRIYFSLKVETINAPVDAGFMRSSPVGSSLFTRSTDAYSLNKSMCVCVYIRVFTYVHMHVPMLR